MEKKDNRKLVAFLGAVLMGMSGSLPIANADGYEPSQVFNVYSESGGGGHEVPTPFELNHRVELADGEHYLLAGKIVFLQDSSGRANPYFAINLQVHPWLASAKRAANPYYPLEGNPAVWQKWDRHTVKLKCIAHHRVEVTAQGVQTVISLEPLRAEVYLK